MTIDKKSVEPTLEELLEEPIIRFPRDHFDHEPGTQAASGQL
jgi:hypothetical protein